MIYFLQEVGHPDGPIKIGYTSKRVDERRDHAQHGYPYGKLHVIGLADGSEAEEQGEHAKWHHLAMRGEWFASSPELLEHIKELDSEYRAREMAAAREAANRLGGGLIT